MKPSHWRLPIIGTAVGCILVVSGCAAFESDDNPSPTAPTAAASPSPGVPAGEGVAETRVEGIVESIDAGTRRLAVAGRTIQVTDATEIRDAIARRVFGDLKRGDRVEVRGRADGDSILAVRIEITAPVDAPGQSPGPGPNPGPAPPLPGPGPNPAPPPPAPGRDVEFTGTLTALSGSAPGATLTIAGRTVRTDGNTLVRRRGDPVAFSRLQVGQVVEVDGVQQSDGSVLASRITIEDEAGQKIDLEGTVSSISGSGLGATLVVASRIVRTNADTVIRRRGDPVPFARLRVGQRVEVRGALQADGSVLADRITLEED